MPGTRNIATLSVPAVLATVIVCNLALAQQAPEANNTREPPAAAAFDTSSAQTAPRTSPPDTSLVAIRPDDVAQLRIAVEHLRADVARLRADIAAGTLLAEQPPDTARNTVTADLKEAQTKLSALVWTVIQSLILILVVFYLIKALSWLLEVLAERDARRRLWFKRLIPMTRILLWTCAVYLIIAVVFEVTQAQLLAGGAAVGIAVGFAAQDVLKNIFGGLIIILDKPFQTGDKINVGGTYGEVVSIGLRATRIQTPDDNLVSVPNAQVVDGQVSNANAGNLECQVVTDLYLPGWVDVMKAKKIAYEAAANSKYVYLEKPIVVIVRDDFKETFLTHLQVKAYVIDTRYEYLLVSDVTETAKAQFLKEGMLAPLLEIDNLTQAHLDEVTNGNQDGTS